jgi:hypothetical protein
MIRLNSISSNFTKLSIGDFQFWFSYETCIAFTHPKLGFLISENIWSNTTGKHLNQLEPDKKQRLKYLDFKEHLDIFLESFYSTKL